MIYAKLIGRKLLNCETNANFAGGGRIAIIILDSNQLRQVAPPDGALLSLLNKLAELSGHELAIPEMVLIEHLAHVEHEAQLAISLLDKTGRALSKIFIDNLSGKIPILHSDDALSIQDAKLREIFTILPIPEGAERSALIREAKRQRPANIEWEKDKSGSGARDAVIFLTVIEAAANREGDTLFLSEDNDFGTDAGWHDDLCAEVGDLNLRLLHRGINQLLDELAEKTSEPSNLMEILRHPIVVDAVAAAYAGQDVFFELVSHVTTGIAGSFIGSSAPRMEAQSRAGKVHAYSIDSITWIAVQVKWAATKSYDVHPVPQPMNKNMRSFTILATPAGIQWIAEVDFNVVNTLLISLEGEGKPTAAEVTNPGILEFSDYHAIGK